MQKPLVSIIVRTKNESYWIGKCLHAIKNQRYKNIEIIVVDNVSKDNTIKLIKKNFPKVKIVKYNEKKFLPGKAINYGIKKSKGKFISIISGHCIPKNSNWIGNLVKNFKNRKVAGVYGRQEPLDTSDFNIVRELTYLFGKDKKIQVKDPFFHNANSMIKRSLWNKYKFDEKALHIEDRIWAQQILKKGYKIIYEPEASVFHYHGVGHNQNYSRVKQISKILKQKSKRKDKKKIICLVPILNPVKIKNKFLIEKAINEIQKIKQIYKTFIICDDIDLKKTFSNKKTLFLNRGQDLKKDFLGTNYVLTEVFNKFIKNKYKPTHVLVFEELYPNRPKNYFNTLIKNFDENFDSLIPISKNKLNNIWKKNYDGSLEIFYKTSLPSSAEPEESLFQEVKGLGTLTSATAFEINGIESSNAKYFKVNSKFSFKYDDYVKNLFKLLNENK